MQPLPEYTSPPSYTDAISDRLSLQEVTATKNNGVYKGRKAEILDSTLDPIIDLAVQTELQDFKRSTMIQSALATSGLIASLFLVLKGLAMVFVGGVTGQFPLIGLGIYAIGLSLTPIFGYCLNVALNRKAASSIDLSREKIKEFINKNFQNVSITPKIVFEIHSIKSKNNEFSDYIFQHFSGLKLTPKFVACIEKLYQKNLVTSSHPETSLIRRNYKSKVNQLKDIIISQQNLIH